MADEFPTTYVLTEDAVVVQWDCPHCGKPNEVKSLLCNMPPTRDGRHIDWCAVLYCCGTRGSFVYVYPAKYVAKKGGRIASTARFNDWPPCPSPA